ncbi:MAG: penicillin-binding protein 2 [Kiritimatiellae bacterium]|nr:penicillin-binding protein 2 [Kiritimatiellia bacterium]
MVNDHNETIRFVLAVAGVVAVFAALGVRLTTLHLAPPEVRETLRNQRRIEKKLLAGRGRILDSKSRDNILAINLPVKHVGANPEEILQSGRIDEVVELLTSRLQLPARLVCERLKRPGKRYVCIQRFVPETIAAPLQSLKLPGLFFEEDTFRFYPHGSSLCHVLGFVNHDGIGAAGVEQYLDKYLRGCEGLRETSVDAKRRELYLMRLQEMPALSGADVYLTIDQDIQYFVEQELDAAVAETRAKGACAIVQRVRTGEILAMVSRPAFDPNHIATVTEAQLLNRALGLVYEPGSTLKVVTISAALNEKTVTPDTVYDCENGAWTYCGRTLRDTHPHGRLTVADGVKVSSNILTAKVALTLGNERLYRYLTKFGIGNKLGVDLPGEEGGILRPHSKWSAIDLTRIAIGQGVAVTPLQMLGVMCAIANDGILMRPYVIRRVISNDGKVLLDSCPERLSQPVSYNTAATMRRLLVRVTEPGGTGRRAQVPGYEVAGKTGTAQKAVGGRYCDGLYVASFVGFLPASDPEVGIIVVLDEPQDAYYGGTVAAPVFARIATQTMRYLGISPSPGMEVAKRDVGE